MVPSNFWHVWKLFSANTLWVLKITRYAWFKLFCDLYCHLNVWCPKIFCYHPLTFLPLKPYLELHESIIASSVHHLQASNHYFPTLHTFLKQPTITFLYISISSNAKPKSTFWRCQLTSTLFLFTSILSWAERSHVHNRSVCIYLIYHLWRETLKLLARLNVKTVQIIVLHTCTFE